MTIKKNIWSEWQKTNHLNDYIEKNTIQILFQL